jgi:hypothetical protein
LNLLDAARRGYFKRYKGIKGMQTEFNSDTVVERGKAAWESLPETLTVAGDYEKLHELLLAERSSPDFGDILRRAMLAMHRRGRDSGVAEVMRALIGAGADTIEVGDISV